MKTATLLLLALSSLFMNHQAWAQSNAEMDASLQFSSMFIGTKNGFADLKGDWLTEDENFVYYKSEQGLGSHVFTVLNSKSDSTEWYCYIEFSMEADLTELPAIQNGTFSVLNMMVSGGKITGTESTVDDSIRTDLYASATNTWLGELVTDQTKKTFHILLKNTPW